MTEPWLAGGRRTTVTVGTFDGVHNGHRAVLGEIVRRARAAGRASVLVTFEPHPLAVVAPERAPCRLTTADERRLLWPLFDLDHVLVLAFTEALRRLSPEAFVRTVLVERLRVGELVIGHDHGFGRDRSGDVDDLRRLGALHGFAVDVVGAVAGPGGEPISSTRIRRAIAAADLAGAEAMLGRPVSTLGAVERGAGRGRTLGWPTVNLRLPEAGKCLPPDGVYAVRLEAGGALRPGVANLGPRPTFGVDARGLEVHVLDGDPGPLDGARPAVEFAARLRDVRRFASPEALAGQIAADAAAARAALGLPPGDRRGLT